MTADCGTDARSEELLYGSPCGWIRLRGEGGRLCRVELLDGPVAAGRTTGPREEGLARFSEMLDGYFGGRPIVCPAVLLRLDGASRFGRRVYESLREVPFGETVSYGELARMCGRPGAARAVGRALGANPAPIFVPCHRVVRKDGSPGGFSAGLRWKERLLGHEAKLSRNGSAVAELRICCLKGLKPGETANDEIRMTNQ